MDYRWPRPQTFVITAVLATICSGILTLSRPVDMLVDGQPVQSDVPPVTTSAQHIYVPLRSVADALGAQTIVDGDKVYVVRGTQSLRVELGSDKATINGMPFTMHHAPFRVRGRVMIGLKPISDAFGVAATYDARTARVDILSGLGAAATPAPPDTQ
ncbi:MAG: copper amine oxidase N-terminal domain-containing protein [Candidatus Eremiobacteraeota bacterium]|nr:copper amine oxidase N-terminal domain-containing protein [Candidatus Eremiobacteraeota bacterium]